MTMCKDCGYYRPIGDGLGICPRSVCPFGGDSEPVCDQFLRPKQTLEKLSVEERETQTIAGKFAEALGCLEDAGHWLRELNQEFEKLYPDDMDPRDPAAPFWYAVNEAITSEPFTDSPLRDILQELQAVRKYVPKETEPVKEQVP